MLKSLSITQLRSRMAGQIIVFNTLLVVLTIVYYIAKGFDAEEFSSLLTLLTAVSAIYFGTLFQYIGNSLQAIVVHRNHPIPKVAQLIQWIVPVHFILIAGIISAKAFTQITFKEMNIFLGLIEAIFGTYVGYIITTLFNLEKINQHEA